MSLPLFSNTHTHTHIHIYIILPRCVCVRLLAWPQDIIPPAVQTELHELQPELVAAGQAQIGMPLKAFIDETWAALDRWDENEDEIMVKEVAQRWGHIDDGKKEAFKQLQAMMKAMAGS